MHTVSTEESTAGSEARPLARSGACLRLAVWGFLVAFPFSLLPASASAEAGIGAATIVVNRVTGDLPSRSSLVVMPGDAVYQDEDVRTDAQSSAKLVLSDQTGLSLGPSSSLKLDKFVYGGPSQPGAITMNLLKGALTFTTGNASKQAYSINTPTATLGVRGTILDIRASDRRTDVTLEEGEAIVCMRGRARCVSLTPANPHAVVTATQVAFEAHIENATPSGVGVASDDLVPMPETPSNPSFSLFEAHVEGSGAATQPLAGQQGGGSQGSASGPYDALVAGIQAYSNPIGGTDLPFSLSTPNFANFDRFLKTEFGHQRSPNSITILTDTPGLTGNLPGSGPSLSAPGPVAGAGLAPALGLGALAIWRRRRPRPLA